MTPPLRVKFGLLTIAATFLAVFAWSTAQGQFQPGRPPINPPGGFNGMNRPGGFNGMNRPGGIGGGGIGLSWSCPKCGQTGPGAIPPQTCPGCGVHFINGIGNGSAGGIMGNPGGAPPMNPGFNPGMNPPGMNQPPPGFNQPPPVTNQPPVFNQPPANTGNAPAPNPVVNPVPATDPAPAASASDSSSTETKSPKRWVIALVIGIIVVGVFVLLGGTFLVIYTMRSGDSKPRKSRRRRDDDYDD